MTKQEAIDWAGSMTALAERLGITVGAVSQWDHVPELQQHRLWMLSAGKLAIDPEMIPGAQVSAKQKEAR